MWLVFAFLSAFFAGITSVLAKIGIKGVDSNLATALRTVVVLIFAWIMVFIVGSQNTIGEISQQSLLFLVLSGLSTGASWLCYYRALQMGDISKIAPVDKSSVVLTMVLAVIILGEAIGPLKIVAMVVLLIGTYMMIDWRKGKNAQNANGTAWLVFALLSAVFASLTSIFGKIGIEGVESNLGTAIRTCVILLLAWGIAIGTGKIGQIKHIDKKSWLFLGLSGLATGLSWLCFYKALQDGPASVVVPIDKLSILVSVAFAYIIFKERLSKMAAWGLVLVTIGTLALIITI